jgi:flagellar motor component MotA
MRSAGKPVGSQPENNKSLILWESASRSFWMVGVLATLIAFVMTMADSTGGIGGIATRMAAALVPTVYGVILSVICLVPAMKLKESRVSRSLEGKTELEGKLGEGAIAPLCIENIIGYVLIAAIIVWSLIESALSSNDPILEAWEWIVYWPSLLVVLGGTIAIVLFVGNSPKGRTFTFGFAVTGLIGSLMGIIQVLLGFASRSIEDIAAAITFILSSCFFALLGLMIVGSPLEDRAIKTTSTAKHSTLSRVVWYVFPLVTLILLVITFFLIITPMKKQV